MDVSSFNRIDGESMYRAATEGDWLAAEILLSRNPNLAKDCITEEGDRALHVAAAMRHEQFLQNLVDKISPSDLTLLDGHGYTACCYAAMAGIVEIVDAMVEKNPGVCTARDKYGKTPLHKAALRARSELVSYFLLWVEVQSFPKEEWFDLLLATIDNEIPDFLPDVALKILEKDASLATMRNEEGTALHLLAREDISTSYFYSKEANYWMRDAMLFFPGSKIKVDEMQPDLSLLVEKLWAEIQRLDEPLVLELMREPRILHDAAKIGNAELLTMITRSYPSLIWDIDSNGYTVFHIAVIYRRENVFRLIHQIGARKHFVSVSKDSDSNNILHLAAKLAPPSSRKIASESLMQREVKWFKVLEEIVPPPCRETKNKYGQTPRELFTVEHKAMLEKSEAWMRNTADSCMLVATILLTVVFVAAFTVPGGNNGETGIPIHLKSVWFTCFIITDALAVFFSLASIVMFWATMTSNFEEDEFMITLLSQLMIGLYCLLFALIHAISAFVAAYFVVFVKQRAALVTSVIVSVYVGLNFAIIYQFLMLWYDLLLPTAFSYSLSHSSRDRVFKRDDDAPPTIRSRVRAMSDACVRAIVRWAVLL